MASAPFKDNLFKRIPGTRATTCYGVPDGIVDCIRELIDLARDFEGGVRMSERVTVSREDHLAFVSLNHPDRLNVLDLRGWEALADAMTSIGEDADVYCVVIAGSWHKVARQRQRSPQKRTSSRRMSKPQGIHSRSFHSLRFVRTTCVSLAAKAKSPRSTATTK